MKHSKHICFFACFLIAICAFSSPAGALTNSGAGLVPVFASQSVPYLYDNFSNDKLDISKWKSLEFVRKVSPEGVLTSKIRATNADERNRTTISSGSLIDKLTADIRIVEANRVSGANLEVFGRIAGFFYNADFNSPSDATGEIWAGVFIGDRGEGLEAWWAVQKSLDETYDNFEPLADGVLIDPGILDFNTFYTIEIEYIGGEVFLFSISGPGITSTTELFEGPVFQGPSFDGRKHLVTGINMGGTDGEGDVSADFDNVFIDNILHDDFNTLELHPGRWHERAYIREIVNDKVRLASSSRGPRETTRLFFKEIKPYIKTDLTVSNDSWVAPGSLGRARIGDYFYNDTYGPGSGLPYNDHEGETFFRIYIDQVNAGPLRAACGAFRTDTPNDTAWTTLFDYTFPIPIVPDRAYTISIHFLNPQVIFTCKDTVTQVEETFEYMIPTPTYPSSQTYRQLSSRVWGTGTMDATFDNVYVADAQFNNVGDELAVDFKTAGIWIYDFLSWRRVYQGFDPEKLCAFGTQLAIDFGTATGLYAYDQGVLSRIYKGVPIEKMTGLNENLAVDFGSSYGIYEYDYAMDSWQRIYMYSSSRDEMVHIGGKLVVDFKTFGLYAYQNNAWSRFYKGVDPEKILPFEDMLVVDFGPAYGLYLYDFVSDTWNRIYKGVSIEKIVEFDGKLAVDFGAVYGLYAYDPGTDSWERIYKGVAIEKMTGFADKLAVDFGTTYGIYGYDFTSSTWSRIYKYQVERDEIVSLNIFP